MLLPLLAAAREEEGKCRCLAVNTTRQQPFLIIIPILLSTQQLWYYSCYYINSNYRLQSNKVQHQRLGFGLFFGCELEREGEGEPMSHRHRRSELFIFSEEKIFCVFENFITS